MNFGIEVRGDSIRREVEADKWMEADGWLIFLRLPAEGGSAREYWRIQRSEVVSMETKR